MKNINNFIIEKLKINKNTKIRSIGTDDKFIDGIFSIIINDKIPVKNETKLRNALSDWINDNIDFERKIKVNIYIEKRFNTDQFTEQKIQDNLIQNLGINFMYDEASVNNFIKKMDKLSTIRLYMDNNYSFIYTEKLKSKDLSFLYVCNDKRRFILLPMQI